MKDSIGGAEGAGGNLRPTWGCVRLHDNDMGQLVRLVRELGISEYLGVEWS